jgi:hypothetical protein
LSQLTKRERKRREKQQQILLKKQNKKTEMAQKLKSLLRQAFDLFREKDIDGVSTS